MRNNFYYYSEHGWNTRSNTKHYPLEDLYQYLDDKQMRWIKCTEDKLDPKRVMIWSEWNIKAPLSYKIFNPYNEFLEYAKRYHKYSRKRLKEMPSIKISKENLEFLEQQWKDIYKRKPQFLIFREHDNGFVDIIEKNELSDQDLKIMEREHKIYLNYIKRWEAYLKAHPEKRSKEWRTPADDEYESDFALYDPVDEIGVDE